MSVIGKNVFNLVGDTIYRGVIGAIVGKICGTKVKETALLFATLSLGQEILSKSVNQWMGVERKDISNKVLAVNIAIKALHATILIIGLRELGVIGTKGTIFFTALEGAVITLTIFREPLSQILNDIESTEFSKAFRKQLNPAISWTNSIKKKQEKDLELAVR
jgi:hypothetical protein